MPDRQVYNFIRKVRKRLSVHKVCNYTLDGLLIGLMLWTLVAVVALVVPIYPATYIGAGATCICTFAGFIAALVKRPSMKSAALSADALGLEERVITAYELKGRDDAMSSMQKADAVEKIKAFNIKKKIRFKRDKRRIILLFVLPVLVICISLIKTDAKAEAEIKHELEKVKKEQIEKIEEEIEKVKEVYEPSDEEIKKLEEMLEQMKKELLDAATEKGMEKTEERFETKLEQALNESIRPEALDKLSDKLNDLNNSDLSDKEREELLKDLSEKLEKIGKYEKNDDMVEAANEIKASKGNASAIDKATKTVSVSKAQKVAEAKEKSESGEKTDVVKQGDDQDGNKNGNGKESVNGKGDGDGEGSGVREGNGNGTAIEGGEGEGSQTGVSQGGTGTGWDNGSETADEKNFEGGGERITIPNGKGDTSVTGKANETGDSYSTTEGGAFMWDGVSTDYRKVVGDYTNQAFSDMQEGTYPDSIKGIIKDYFSEINGK